ncbi:hypothetical protein SRHO_G00273800 [Serrasalmus rhombeus]
MKAEAYQGIYAMRDLKGGRLAEQCLLTLESPANLHSIHKESEEMRARLRIKSKKGTEQPQQDIRKITYSEQLLANQHDGE